MRFVCACRAKHFLSGLMRSHNSKFMPSNKWRKILDYSNLINIHAWRAIVGRSKMHSLWPFQPSRKSTHQTLTGDSKINVMSMPRWSINYNLQFSLNGGNASVDQSVFWIFMGRAMVLCLLTVCICHLSSILYRRAFIGRADVAFVSRGFLAFMIRFALRTTPHPKASIKCHCIWFLYLYHNTSSHTTARAGPARACVWQRLLNWIDGVMIALFNILLITLVGLLHAHLPHSIRVFAFTPFDSMKHCWTTLHWI